MKFGLMFFAASDDSLGADKYRLVLESARFGDRAGFSSVWVAERHFTRFGGLYPNPAVLHAGLATATSRIRLQAGSVVAPLHHPLRIAEEWSVVDNLSNGRIGVSFASGWNPDDFMFFPDHYKDRHDRLFDTMAEVQRLWTGGAWEGTNGVGQPASVRIFPKPVQATLPIWVTVAGNPKTFERAGASGGHLLTHLLDQDEATLASKIALYRNARAAAGFDPATGIVSLMVHTLVGADAHTVREAARKPYCNYIKANIGLFKGLEQSRGRDVDLSKISEADLDEFVNFLYERFAAARGLIGTPESCAPLVSRLEAIGVNELACLLDFGPSDNLILANLPNLARLKDMFDASATPATATAHFDRDAVIARSVGVGFRRWRGDREALAEVVLPPADDAFQLHPAALDECARVLALASAATIDEADYTATGFGALDLTGPIAGTAWMHAVMTSTSVGDVALYDEAGRSIARVEGLQLAPRSPQAAPAPATNPLDELLYERVWRPAPEISKAALPTEGRRAIGAWRIVADAGGVASALVKRIQQIGGECVALGGEHLSGVIYLRGLDSTAGAAATDVDIEADVARALRESLRLITAGGSTPMFIVTRGAVSVPQSGAVGHVSQATLWGLGRALAVERPGALGALVDLDPNASAAQCADQILNVLLSDRAEDMVAFRDNAAYVPRLARTSVAGAESSSLHFAEDETVLVTGGTGGLGLRLVEWLAACGAQRVIVCGRREPGPAADVVFERLRASGVEVDVWQLDVADRAALAAQFDRFASAGHRVTSVFHLAGVLDDGLLGTQSWDRFAAVGASKIAGAWNLHQLTRANALRHFVMFSSVSSILPAPGQSAYAAANAFLDALAHLRRAEGLHALSVNWGPWAEAGHAETAYGRQAHAHLATLGIGAIAPDRGLDVLASLLAGDRTEVAVVQVDWEQLRRTDPMAARLGLVSEVIPRDQPTRTAVVTQSSPLIDALRKLPADERRPYLLRHLSDLIVAALKLRTDEPIDPQSRLFDIGLDSIMALELKDKLERSIGVPLSATLLFVYPTLDALCDYLFGEIAASIGAAPVAAPAAAPASTPTPPPSPASADGELTEDELTRLLLKEIEASRGT